MRRSRLRGFRLLFLLATSSCIDFGPSCGGHFIVLHVADSADIYALHPGDVVPVDAGLVKGRRPQDGCATEYASSDGTGFEWKSTNPSVVSVVNGEITANGVGTADIIATAAGVSGSIQLTVVPRPAPFSVP